MLSCIDPRFTDDEVRFMRDRKMGGRYSHFSFAGAAIGVVAPAFADWHKTFWDNLAVSVQLHKIQTVVVFNHRDCGAAKIAFGEARVSTRESETALHREVFVEFRGQLAKRQPQLNLITALADTNGKVEVLD